MKNEVIKTEIILSVLDDVRKELYELSDTFIACTPNSPYYPDSCKVVNARYKLARLFNSLEFLSEYAKD